MLSYPKGHILIAEDDEDDQYLLSSAFNKIAPDCNLVFVHNGNEILNYFENFESGKQAFLPALVVLDLNMPQRDGKQALVELSKRSYYDELLVVVFSTTGNPNEINFCAELGVHDFFVKPSSYSDLLVIVEKFLKLAKSKIA